LKKGKDTDSEGGGIQREMAGGEGSVAFVVVLTFYI